MSLNSTSCASALSAANDSAITSYPSSSFANDFATAYDNYQKAGVLSGLGGLNGTEDKTVLSGFINSFPSTTTPDDFAQALADYWATCKLTMGAGVIVIVNNASTKKAAFKSAIEASMSDTESTPYYKDFIQNIENVAKTIQWTVTRAGVPPVVTIETIS